MNASDPRTFLIVDDNVEFRAAARLLLEDEGWRVAGEAHNGATALRAARDLRPDAVLLDVDLPDRDGFAVSEEILAAPNAPLVILISSRDVPDFGPLVKRSGAAGFISKADLSGEALRRLLRHTG